jgi:hypothetical protein
MRTPSRHISALVLLILAVAACAGPASAEPPAVVLTDEGCNRTGTETLPAAANSIGIRNESGALGSFELVRLDASFPELLAYVVEQQARIASGQLPEGIPPFVTQVGHLLLNPMGSGTIDAILAPGLHAVVCTRLAASDEAALSIFLVGPYSVAE